MRTVTFLTLALGIGLLVLSGCTSTQLRKDTTREARTLSEIYEQQVLDNLAKFVYDLNSMPHFALADAGSVAVQDQLNGNGNASWTKGGPLNAAGFQIGGQRQLTDSWTTIPISDPRKLELMRCAYQMAVRAAMRYRTRTECKNCTQLINLYYTGSAAQGIQAARAALNPPMTGDPCPGAAPVVTHREQVTESEVKAPEQDNWPAQCPSPPPKLSSPKSAPCQPISPQAEVVPRGPTAAPKTSPPQLQQELTDLYGYTADDLQTTCCWFRVCCPKCISKHRHECCKVGEYCGVYVVVEPGIGQEMLTRLTLVMLDFAQYQGAIKAPGKKDDFQSNVAKYLTIRIEKLSCDIRATEIALYDPQLQPGKREAMLEYYSKEIADLKTLLDMRAAVTGAQAAQPSGSGAQGTAVQRQRNPTTFPSPLLPLLQRESTLMGVFQ